MVNAEFENIFLTDEDLIKKCKKLCNEHTEILGTYFLNYHRKKDSRHIKEVKYSIGGEIIHRGYYCPSPIKDLYVSNVKRGRIVKKPSNNIDYKYHFDENNRIIGCYKMKPDIQTYGKEYIWYSDNMQYGVDIANVNMHPNLVSSILRCVYDNDKIVRYELGYIFGENSVNYIDIEEYFYSENDILTSALVYTYYVYNDQPRLTNRYLYKFIRNELDVVIGYEVDIMYDGQIVKTGYCDISKSKQRKLEKYTGTII